MQNLNCIWRNIHINIYPPEYKLTILIRSNYDLYYTFRELNSALKTVYVFKSFSLIF